MKFLMGLSILAGLFLTVNLACVRSFSFGPLSPPTSVFTPTVTPTLTSTPSVCNGNWGTPVPCVGGVNWGQSLVWNYNVSGSGQYGAEVALAVNCSPETTAGVTLTGPGVSLPLGYSGLTVIGGISYADFQGGPVAGNMTPGGFYTLASATSLGTASSSLALPAPLTITGSSNPLTVTWAGGLACLNLFTATAGVTTLLTGPGYEGIPPYIDSVGAISCFSCQSGARFIVGTPNITGGSGIYTIANGAVINIP